MTNKEKFAEVIEALGELIAEKNQKISLLEWQLEEANKKIKEAEACVIKKDNTIYYR